jgi:hypothetical protein
MQILAYHWSIQEWSKEALVVIWIEVLKPDIFHFTGGGLVDETWR